MESITGISSLNGTAVPVYTIDLALPPKERYVHIAQEMGPRMRSLTPLFDELLSLFIFWAWLRRTIEFLATIFLRRVSSSEQMDEIRSISAVSKVPLHFLVALNVLLDCLLGCTSGGVMTRIDGVKRTKGWHMEDHERMLHFRTLDWGMDALRSVLVVLEFRDSTSSTPNKVIAKTVTYAGMVGVLTGVRTNLSISLNFRPNHTCSKMALYSHLTMVLLGFRHATPSVLRDMILSDPVQQSRKSLTMVVRDFEATRTAPCYLVLCDGSVTVAVEKDLYTAESRLSDEFIVHTNHDTDSSGISRAGQTLAGGLMPEDWLEESESRMECMTKKWNKLKRRYAQTRQENGVADHVSDGAVIGEKLLRKWMTAYPTRNEMTHYSCIMDPKKCDIKWIERGIVDCEIEE